MSTKKKLNLLFLCTGNSCRSQMAEGWTRTLKAGLIEPFSAGIEARGIDPKAVQVMAEAGVDISHHRSKTTADLDGREFDYVITVCSDADQNCPFFPAKTKILHFGFDDPPRIAGRAASEAEALAVYRRVRDEIRKYIETLPEALTG